MGQTWRNGGQSLGSLAAAAIPPTSPPEVIHPASLSLEVVARDGIKPQTPAFSGLSRVRICSGPALCVDSHAIWHMNGHPCM